MKEEAIPTFNTCMGRRNYVFQQDNAPCHVSVFSKKFFEDNKVALMDWPACSPDLNPIENLWAILSGMIYKGGRVFSSKKELTERVLKCWNKIDLSICENLVNSMDSRCEKVLESNGDIIKY
eukprot:GAHX01004137.1.p2 GENE.GAHX01004137.1~~GAHX01004137.1.p2  ORF type:complete len:122 (-),score=20.94 GAHX01004137.1:72-437(-)